jgi:hypothetical protein
MQNPLCHLHELLTLVGEFERSGGALEQLHPVHSLDLRDRSAQRRLRQHQ